MKSSDVGRRVVVFESNDKPGITGKVVSVYDEFNFRIVTDNGKEYEFCTKLINVSFKDKGGNL